MYDVIIIGAGPAGLSAGIYAARHKLHTLVVTKHVPAIQHGQPEYLGLEFVVANFKQLLQAEEKFLQLAKDTAIISLEKNIVSFALEEQSGKIVYSRSVIVATGQDSQGFGNSQFEHLTNKTAQGKIMVDADMQTNVEGLYAAGHVNSAAGKDTFIASAEGAKAALAAADYLKSLK